MRSAYVTHDQASMMIEKLSMRDRAILVDIARVRVLTGGQLTRLHFADLAPDSRERTRRRVLARLAELQVIARLDGRIVGGANAGSRGYTYSLGIAGQRLLPLLETAEYGNAPERRIRAPVTPGRLFLAHSLAISELYTQLRERERHGQLRLAAFVVEAAAWYPDERGGFLKPDAYVRIQSADVEDIYWIEVDLATESVPTLRRKLRAYIDFARARSIGPDGVMPRVIVTVPHDRRLSAVRDLVDELPAPAAELILSALHHQAAPSMINRLRG